MKTFNEGESCLGGTVEKKLSLGNLSTDLIDSPRNIILL